MFSTLQSALLSVVPPWGHFGIAAHYLRTGERAALNGNQSFPSASVIKLAIWLTVLDGVAQGHLDLNTPLTLQEIHKEPGDGLFHEFTPGVRLPLRDACVAMIVASDNTATNLVLDHIGVPAVNAYLARLGLVGTRLHRWVGLQNARPGMPPGLGRVVPNEVVGLLTRLQQGDLLPAELTQEALHVLGRLQDASMFPRYLPDGTPIAHKTGSISGLRSDVGIITVPDGGLLVLAVIAANVPDEREWVDNAGQLAVARIAKAAYDYLTDCSR